MRIGGNKEWIVGGKRAEVEVVKAVKSGRTLVQEARSCLIDVRPEA